MTLSYESCLFLAVLLPKLSHSSAQQMEFNLPLQHHNLHEKKQQRPLNRVQEENDRVLLPLQSCLRMQNRWSRFDRRAKKTYPAALIADAQFNVTLYKKLIQLKKSFDPIVNPQMIDAQRQILCLGIYIIGGDNWNSLN